MSQIFTGLTIKDVQNTYRKIRPYILKTPLIRSYYLENVVKKEVYLKLEYLQPTRSFKVRGALSKALSLNSQVLKKGLVTASGGNHGLGVCYAGKELEAPTTVFLPEGTNQETKKAIENWGAEVFLYGKAWDEANIAGQKYAKEKEKAYVHAFDDIAVVRGQGTIALEMLEQNPFLDAIIVSVGGGGLISGVGMVAHQMKPEIRIYGIETVGADAVTQSFHQEKLVELPAITSIAKTLGAKKTTQATLDRIKAVVNDMQTVTDQEALDSLRIMLNHEKILLEPASSCSVAALLLNKFDLKDMDRIGIILCGANITLNELKQWKVV